MTPDPKLIAAMLRELAAIARLSAANRRQWSPDDIEAQALAIIEQPEMADAAENYRKGWEAALAQPGMVGWQPIETAPREGDKVLVVSKSGTVSVEIAAFIQHMRNAAIEDKEPCWFTHWQPLPAAPGVES